MSSSRSRILVDAGLSCREIFRRMRDVGEDPHTLDGIVITHEHLDHVNGLAVTARKLNIPVYMTESTHRAWVRNSTPQQRLSYKQWAEQRRLEKLAAEAFSAAAETEPGINTAEAVQPLNPGLELETEEQDIEESEPAGRQKAGPCEIPAVEYFRAGERFSIGDVEIDSFTIPHDAADPVGFVFHIDGLRVAVATDLGYMPTNVETQLRRCDVMMIESNHDTEMLRDGAYPWSVKQRVMSRVGHLSNESTADFLQRKYDGYASYVILAHLSESNNLPDLARTAAERALAGRMSLLGNHLMLAEQANPMAPIEM